MLSNIEKVIVATSNQGKLKEFRKMLAPFGIEVLSNQELDPDLIPEIVEDGTTFEENALIKANAYFNQFNLPTLADDSGLEVDALNGEPGVYSARYAGPDSHDQENYQKLLRKLEGVPHDQRKARFTCVIALVNGQSSPIIARGQCEGYILERPVGKEGFGYDPVFYVPEKEKSMAELTQAEKNKLSHRYHALNHLLAQLKV